MEKTSYSTEFVLPKQFALTDSLSEGKHENQKKTSVPLLSLFITFDLIKL